MKHLGQTKERETILTMGLGTVMMTDDHAEEVGLLLAQPEHGGGGEGASNKYTFCTVSQLGFSISVLTRFFKCEINVFLQAFTNMLLLKHLGLASFCKYDFAGFRKLLHNFANMVQVSQVSQYVARFHNL